MPQPYPSEFRRKVLDLLDAGRPVGSGTIGSGEMNRLRRRGVNMDADEADAADWGCRSVHVPLALAARRPGSC